MTCELLTTINKKPCDSYIGEGFCSIPTYFRCSEYLKHKEPTLSFSAVNTFMRCPKMYYFSNILGLQVKSEFCSDPIKIGNAIDGYITKGIVPNNGSTEFEYLWEARAFAIYEAFNQLGLDHLRPNYYGQTEFHYQEDGYPRIHGFIDLEAVDKSHFIELKVGKNPKFYTNPFFMRSQLGTYFLSNSKYKKGIVWAIKVPQLMRARQYRDESLSDHKDRCVRVMLSHPGDYFPGYDADTNTFGVAFYRTAYDIKEDVNQYEMSLDGLKNRYRMISWQIQKCAKEEYWYPNGSACLHPFECNYKRVCETGKIGMEIYEYRKKKL